MKRFEGVTYPKLEMEGIQRFFRDGHRMKFFNVPYKEPLEKPNEQYPLWIIPRGFHYHYGIGTTEKRAEGLAKVFPKSAIEISSEDAAKFGLKEGDKVRVISPRGEVETKCRVSDNVPNGLASFSMTFCPVLLNNLLIPGEDLSAKYTEYKYFIGKVEKA